ncbi:MAG: hypothetical protein JST75_09250 [Bacteroidetes bacterium]|nr:hypothetical protein [Bacteroidota bacterium]
MPAKEISKFYEAVLCSPGMEDSVRIDIKVSRKNILLISRLIEHGLKLEENKKDPIFFQITAESFGELEQVREEFLKKGGLNEFYQKLKSFSELA